MAAAVLAPPAPLHPPSGALYDSDDLLALRVLDEAGLVPHGEDYTDDLEDLVSLSVTQHLRSKHSQPGLLLSGKPPTYPSSDLSSAGRLASVSTAGNGLHRSTVKTLPISSGSTPLERERFRPGVIGLDRQRSVVAAVDLHNAPDDRPLNMVGMLRADCGDSGKLDDAEPGWETLQIGGTASSPARSVRHGAILSSKTSLGEEGPVFSPVPRSRRRAVTHSPASTLSSNLAGPMQSGRQRSPSSQTHESANSSSPSHPSRPHPRRKSLSAASSARSRPAASPPTPSIRRSGVTSSHVPAAACPETLHWTDSPAPLIYRTSKGELDYGDSGTSRPLRPTDRVLPAIARRLEAERLKALVQRDEESARCLLVSEWAADGSPRRAVEVQVAPKVDDEQHPRNADVRGEAVTAVVDSVPPLQVSPSPTSASAALPSSREAPPHPVATARISSVLGAEFPPQPHAESDIKQSPTPALPAPAREKVDEKPSPRSVEPDCDAAQAGCCRCVVS